MASEIASMRGGGQPLPKSERAFFELRFGHDFNKVRIHTGAQAKRAAWAVNARAYTMGTDIIFGQGQFSHGKNDSRRLLAHELTHVIQQNHKTTKKRDRKGNANPYEIDRKENGYLDKILNPPPKLIPNPSIPVPGNCGQLSWETSWELSKYGRGGFVIQEVHWNEKLTRYRDRPWSEEFNKTYYEAWWVVKNGKFPSNDDAVPDTMGRKRPHKSLKGSIKIDAIARYHDNVEEAALPGDMVRDNRHTFADKLKSSLQNPNLGGNISKPVPHSIHFEWDCRNGIKMTKVLSRVP